MDAEAAATLVEEATKKAGLVWLSWPERAAPPQPVWHVWHDGAAYVLTGGLEQPLPPLPAQVTVTVPSKDKRSRLVTWVASASVVRPGEPGWDELVPVLMGKRLNLPDGEDAPARWARESVLHRLTPTGEVPETPDDRSTGSHAQVPPATPATTPVPRPLHLFGRPLRRRGQR